MADTLRSKKGNFGLLRGNVTKPKTMATNSSLPARHTLPRDGKAQAKAASPALGRLPLALWGRVFFLPRVHIAQPKRRGVGVGKGAELGRMPPRPCLLYQLALAFD